MSKKYDAFGTQLQMGDGAMPEVFTTVAGLRDIDGPGGDTEVRDATSHDSPGQRREKRPGFIDDGDVTLDGLYDPQDPSHVAFLVARDTRAIKNWRIVDVDDDTSTTEFAGFIKSFRRRAPYNDMLGFRAAIEVTGEVTWATAAP